MVDFSNAYLKELIVHFAGNSGNQEDLILSASPARVDDEMLRDLLVKHFLFPFSKDMAFYNFSQDEEKTNLVPEQVFRLFTREGAIAEASSALAEHLYKKTVHPRIRGGEFFVIRFGGCVVEEAEVDALGLFKSESKETYLKVLSSGSEFNLGHDNGMKIGKLDKGCLVFDIEKEEGYRVCIIDSSSPSGEEAAYWKTDFLNLRPREDNFHRTQSILNLCKNFCEEVLTEENHIEKKDQMMIKNRSLDYFKKKEVFNADDFVREVIEEPKVIEVFNEYKQNFFRKHELDNFEEFEISPVAVKNSKKIFKSVLKLDRNFHVYVHGRHDYIEKGFDEEKNMNFYRLFFKEEQ
jgi:hypothetical protein